MQTRTILSAICAAVLLFIPACGGSPAPPGQEAIEMCLPERLPSLGLARDGEILHFAGDSLFNYINGAAEMYHKYGFEEVHVCRYLKEGGEVTVDIYRFGGPDRAFGMYTTLRPDDPDTVAVGVEGFIYGPILVYAKGPYMVNVQTYDDAVFGPADMKAVAGAVGKDLPGTRNLPGATKLPDTFGLFPDALRVPHSEKIFAESYLGRGFLTDVYTVDYSLEAGKATLFVTQDTSGAKLDMWMEAVGPSAPSTEAITMPHDHMPYDQGRAAFLWERYYGNVVAGNKGGRLAGMVGYQDGHEKALREWLETLPQAPEH
jgi:hypothetical protein